MSNAATQRSCLRDARGGCEPGVEQSQEPAGRLHAVRSVSAVAVVSGLFVTKNPWSLLPIREDFSKSCARALVLLVHVGETAQTGGLIRTSIHSTLRGRRGYSCTTKRTPPAFIPSSHQISRRLATTQRSRSLRCPPTAVPNKPTRKRRFHDGDPPPPLPAHRCPRRTTPAVGPQPCTRAEFSSPPRVQPYAATSANGDTPFAAGRRLRHPVERVGRRRGPWNRFWLGGRNATNFLLVEYASEFWGNSGVRAAVSEPPATAVPECSTVASEAARLRAATCH
jgi:hypothetical protein